jgi:hypothetical protein
MMCRNIIFVSTLCCLCCYVMASAIGLFLYTLYLKLKGVKKNEMDGA